MTIPAAVNAFGVPANQSIRYPIPPNTPTATRRYMVICQPVDIPAQRLLGSPGLGRPAIERAEYIGRFSFESKRGRCFRRSVPIFATPRELVNPFTSSV